MRAVPALVACALLVGTAHAGSAEERYPVPIVLLDAAATAAFLGGGFYVLVVESREDSYAERDSTAPGLLLVGLGLTTYALGPSIVHLAHANPRGAIRSSVARFALPIVAGYASYALSSDRDAAAMGLVAGVGAAMITDWALFAKTPGVHFVAAPTANGGTVGLAGRF
jgi:hypothetical protein